MVSFPLEWWLYVLKQYPMTSALISQSHGLPARECRQASCSVSPVARNREGLLPHLGSPCSEIKNIISTLESDLWVCFQGAVSHPIKFTGVGWGWSAGWSHCFPTNWPTHWPIYLFLWGSSNEPPASAIILCSCICPWCMKRLLSVSQQMC